MTTDKLTALILAGERPDGDPMAKSAGVALKALLPVAGTPMLDRVVEALRATDCVGRIVVSIPDPSAVTDPALETLATEPSPSRSVLAAIDQLPTPLLVTTADHALLTADIVARFVQAAAAASDADLVAGMVERSAVEAVVRDTKRTYWRFKDGAYSGANLFYLKNPRARAAVDFWCRVEIERKRPWRIVQAFGPSLLLGYLFGRLSLDQAMLQASSRLGCRVRAIALPFGEAAIDVDKPADLVLVEKLLADRNAPALS